MTFLCLSFNTVERGTMGMTLQITLNGTEQD